MPSFQTRCDAVAIAKKILVSPFRRPDLGQEFWPQLFDQFSAGP